MRWHDEHVQEDGVMSHPSDDEAWKHFDQTYPLFAEETQLTTLWKGVRTYDISKENNFTMRAALLWTINDFSAYGMLSGWSTYGKKACPYCMENSKAFSLSNGGKTNLIRHNLDVMHIEKNVFKNVFETVMDIEGKTKDNAKARDDVKIYCKRKELEKNESTEKYPKACYSLGKDEKKVVCDWVSKLKFPDGYVSNMARCVDMKKYKMF
ncbi:uncharacterized protein Tco_0933038, partial [Tanacetum coccineum]